MCKWTRCLSPLDSGWTYVGARPPNAGFIGYEIFQDPGQTTRWGSTPGGATEVIMGSLTGNTQADGYQIYGFVPAQTAPGLGTYEDKMIVTVEY